MIAYTTVGTNDLEKAAGFYDSLFKEIGIGRVFEQDGSVAWGKSMGEPVFSVMRPFNKEPATVGNGCMVALRASGPEEVDKLYAKAMELGGADEGAPGPRGDMFYCGYFRDLDGNKLNAFCMKQG